MAERNSSQEFQWLVSDSKDEVLRVRLRRNITGICAALCWMSLGLPAGAEERFHTSPYCWETPRLYQHGGELSPHRELELERREDDWPGGGVTSPNGAYAATHVSAWNDSTQTHDGGIWIYRERPYLVQLALTDHRGIEEPTWINEKLLFVRVWWGRVLATDLIIDVERERILHQEQTHLGTIAWGQFKQCELPEWKETMDSCSCYPGADHAWRPRRGIAKSFSAELSTVETPERDGRSSTCEAGDTLHFQCLLETGEQVAVCGFKGSTLEDRDNGQRQLQVRLHLGEELVWQWPTDRQSPGQFFYTEQAHVRSHSYHLWFERQGQWVDVVDHWTEGSYDSHFAGLVYGGSEGETPRPVSCQDEEPWIALRQLADVVSHRPLP